MIPIVPLALMAAMELPDAAYEPAPLNLAQSNGPVTLAKSDKSRPANAHGKGQTAYTIADCPPGLAKKNPPCVPPGLAQQAHPYRPGDRLSGDYLAIDGSRHGWDGRYGYYRQGGYVIQVDRSTMEVIGLMGLVSDLLN